MNKINNYIFELNNDDITKLKHESVLNVKKNIRWDTKDNKCENESNSCNKDAVNNKTANSLRSSYKLEGITLSNRYYLMNMIQDKKYTVIYKAKCLILNRCVMVEILKQKNEVNLDEFIVYDKLANNFIKGNQAIAVLNFPNVISVYDVGDDAGIKYSVRESTAGYTTLSEKFNEKGNKPFSLNKTLLCAKQIIRIIDSVYKHTAFLHCDICPENIYLNQNGEIMLNYTFLSFDNNKTKTEAEICKIATITVLHENYNYVYPEREPCLQSDMYSIGCVMFKMIFGHDVFEKESQDMMSLLMAHLTKTPEFPKDYGNNVKQRLFNIVKRLLNKNSDNRYISFDELLADMNKIHTGFFEKFMNR